MNLVNRSLVTIHSRVSSIRHSITKLAIITAAVLIAAPASYSQTATVYGQLSNFDVVNNTGHDAHGFEIELEGVQVNDIPYSFSAERYGPAAIIPTATGVVVRWTSSYDAGAFQQSTVPHQSGTTFAGSCYSWGQNYDQAGCEHFGVSLSKTATQTVYRWLIEDAANPGTLIGVDPPVAIPGSPVYTIVPPARPGEAPVLEAEIEAPEAPEAGELYGDAQWVKVFKTELQREVALDELMSDNAIVPQDAAHLETEWELVQQEPVGADGGRQRRRNQGGLAFDTRSVVRRYEIYTFTGQYDPVTHQAICADLACTAPATDEVGDYIGAQMTAANVIPYSLTVRPVGGGSVSSTDKMISCGSKCGAGYNRNTPVTLTASANSGNIFVGWGGACAGNALTCTLSITDAVNVTANFAQMFKFGVSTSGKGTVIGDNGINCGKTCNASVPDGTVITMTAAPTTGFVFSNWTGACTGTSSTCTVRVGGNVSAQAVFIKQ